LSDLPNPDQVVWLDIVLVLTVILSLGLGLVRGLLREVLSLGSWIVSGWLAFLYGDNLAAVLTPWLESAKLSLLISIVVVFLVTLVSLSLAGSLTLKLFRVSGLTGLDRTLGGGFGLMRGIIIITVVLFAAGFTPAPGKAWFRASSIVPFFQAPLTWLKLGVSQRISTGFFPGAVPGLDSDQGQ
jgi:membrane protein required for colicin V production